MDDATDLGGWDSDGQTFQFARADAARSFVERASDFTGVTLASDLLTNRDNTRNNFSGMFSALADQVLYTGTAFSRDEAAEDAFNEAIDRIKRLTGVELQNPYLAGYQDEAFRRLRQLPPTQRPRAGTGQEVMAARKFAADVFQEKLAELRKANRDVATDLTFDPRTAAIGLAQRAEVKAQIAADKVKSPLLWGVASLAGGVYGQRRDPLFWASLVVGPSASVGKSVASRIGSAALIQGSFNAGLNALQQPLVQAWRRDIGQESGVMPAIEEVGFAFLMGAIPGAGIQGGVEAVRALSPAMRRIFNRTATPAETADVLRKLQPAAAKELEPLLEQAQRTVEADELIAADRPNGVSPAAHDAAVIQATRHLEDPEGMPPPETARPIPPAKADEAPIADGAPLLDDGARVTIDGKPATFERLDPQTLGTDAVTFQYKSNADASGVTDRLRNVTRWDPIAASKVIVYEFKDGRRVIADGHQRLGLARRLLDQGNEQRIALDGFVFREADGWAPADIRALAAKKNMQEGSGTSLDAARVLRDRPDLLDGSLPISSPMMKTAVNLSRLSDEAFGMVLNGTVPENFAAAVGGLAPDPSTHSAIMAELARAAPATEREARLLIGDALSAGFRVEEQINLFGASDMTRSLLGERAKILSAVLKALSDEKKVFGTLAARADVIEAAGNVLDKTGNQVRAATAEQLGELIIRLAQRTGPISDRLNRVAEQLAEGGIKPAAAARAFLDDVTKALETEGLASLLEAPRLAPGAVAEPGTTEALEAAGATAETAIARDTQTVDMFAPPPRSATVADLIEGQRGWTVEELHARATLLQEELGAAGDEIAKATGAKFKNPGVKDLETARAKILRKGYRGPHQLTDTARGGFRVTSAAQADEVVRQLQSRFDVLDEGWAVNDTGYFDRKVLVRGADGVIGEVQVIPAQIFDAKKGGLGDLFKKWRVAQNAPEAPALMQQMNEGYLAAVAGSDFAGILERSRRPYSPSNVARQVRSSISPAVLTTSAKSTGDQSSPGASTANAADGSSTAGRQSQLANFMEAPPASDIGATAEARNQTFATESTAIGEQSLIPGVAPVSTRDRLELEASRPMRGGNAAPPAGGLFDQGARDQADIFDLVPIAASDDGAGFRLVDETTALEEADRLDLFADLTQSCKD